MNDDDVECVRMESEEYECAYELIEHAMKMVPDLDLAFLQGALYKASYFVNEELEEMSEKTTELAL